MTKLWGIRHARWLWLAWRLERWVNECAKMGWGFTGNQSDYDYLDAVWRGEE